MIAEIVAIGTELLMGQIADSDAQMLSRELQSLGIAVYHHQVVGDNPQADARGAGAGAFQKRFGHHDGRPLGRRRTT